MGYTTKKIFLENEQKAFLFVMNHLNFSMRDAQKVIDRKRLFENGKVVTKKNSLIKGEIEYLVFEPNPKGLKPIFETEDFALFDKPSGVLIHPKNRKNGYSLTDEIRTLYGERANIVHRIDKETSGLVLVGKNKSVERSLKMAFENRDIKKGYLAYAKGKLDKELFIDEPIAKNREFSSVKLKVHIDKSGKHAQTKITPLKYYENIDATLVEALPYTGRQHQIRVHLFHVKHSIVGDPIYGVDPKTAAMYLDGVLGEEERVMATGAKRLMLHANWIEFEHINRFKIYSKYDFLKEELFDEVGMV